MRSSSGSATAGRCGRSRSPTRTSSRSKTRWTRFERSLGWRVRRSSRKVSAREPYVFSEGTPEVALVDYGTKRSILRRLAKAGAGSRSSRTPRSPTSSGAFEGIVLSNGPGDPEPLRAETEAVRGLLGTVPVLGICLGHQLLGLATGHETFKLPFGHRGANHPVLDRRSGPRAGDEPEPRLRGRDRPRAKRRRTSRCTTGRSRGSTFPELRARSVQFHPEAGPGPHDAWRILDGWVEELRR